MGKFQIQAFLLALFGEDPKTAGAFRRFGTPLRPRSGFEMLRIP